MANAPRITVINVRPGLQNTQISGSFTTAASHFIDGKWHESEKVIHKGSLTPTDDGFFLEFDGVVLNFTIPPTFRDQIATLAAANTKGQGDKVKRVEPSIEGFEPYYQFVATATLPIAASRGAWTVRPILQWSADPRTKNCTERPRISWMIAPVATQATIDPVRF